MSGFLFIMNTEQFLQYLNSQPKKRKYKKRQRFIEDITNTLRETYTKEEHVTLESKCLVLV